MNGGRMIPTHDRSTVLRKAELCQALDISEDLLEELVKSGRIPVVELTPRAPRFIWGQVVDALAATAVTKSAQVLPSPALRVG